MFEFYLYIAGYFVTVQNLCYYGFFPTSVTDMEKVAPELSQALKWISRSDDTARAGFFVTLIVSWEKSQLSFLQVQSELSVKLFGTLKFDCFLHGPL